MKDMQTRLEKLRIEAEECELISKLATNEIKKEMFAKLAAHHRALAEEAEQTIRASKQSTHSAWNSRILAANWRATAGGISIGFRMIGTTGTKYPKPFFRLRKENGPAEGHAGAEFHARRAICDVWFTS
ncbi:hypothetical protein ABIB82_002480 [Bradyrhizobium sp. i1.8.4]|uniref:hypothetical protein n=1 Tax=unclassified Bradyrhizobium TaxID=2631580 RepID=UPI003D24FBB3